MQARLLGKLILAEPQVVMRLRKHGARHEGPRVINDALPDQKVGNIANAEAWRNIDYFLFLERAGGFKTLLGDHEENSASNRYQDQRGEHRIAGDHEGMPHALRPARGHWNSF